MLNLKRPPACAYLGGCLILCMLSAPTMVQGFQTPSCNEGQDAVLVYRHDADAGSSLEAQCSVPGGESPALMEMPGKRLVSVVVNPGYRMRAYSRRDYAGVAHPLIRGTQDVEHLAIRSYFVEAIEGALPRACAQAGGRAALWEEPNYQAYEGAYHCATREQRLPGETEIKTSSLYVAAGYRLVAMIETPSGDMEQRGFVNYEEYADLSAEDGQSLIIKGYLILPSWTIEGIGDTEEEVSVAYRPSGATESKTVTMPTKDIQSVPLRLRTVATAIEYSPDNGETWSVVASLKDLMGADGADGVAGTTPQLRENDGYLQYFFDGEKDWRNLVAVNALKGNKGDMGGTGNPGKNRLNQNNAPFCKRGNEGELRYSNEELWFCDGAQWLSFEKTGIRSGILSAEDRMDEQAWVSSDMGFGHSCAVIADGSVRC